MSPTIILPGTGRGTMSIQRMVEGDRHERNAADHAPSTTSLKKAGGPPPHAGEGEA
jgi:hypothetical protein